MMEGDASQATDDQVQRLIARGEYRSALEALVRGYQRVIVRYCVTMLGDAGHGEEVAQEVFLGAYAAMPRFGRRPRSAPGSWPSPASSASRPCATAGAGDAWRRSGGMRWRSGAHRAPPDPSEEDPEVLCQRVRQGLDRLGAAERTVLLLYYEAGLTLVEVAHIVGRSEAGVRRQLARALQQLREIIDKGL